MSIDNITYHRAKTSLPQSSVVQHFSSEFCMASGKKKLTEVYSCESTLAGKWYPKEKTQWCRAIFVEQNR